MENIYDMPIHLSSMLSVWLSIWPTDQRGRTQDRSLLGRKPCSQRPRSRPCRRPARCARDGCNDWAALREFLEFPHRRQIGLSLVQRYAKH